MRTHTDRRDSTGEGSHEDDGPSTELQQVKEENDFLKQHLNETQTKLDKVTERMRSLANCSLLRECEGVMSEKDTEIECLKQQVTSVQGDIVANA